jgi:carbonic anhydrase/acetyltransferase-like protein (isoleucine patch superfamily)
MKPLILPYKGVLPRISEKAFVAPSASIIGDVEIGAGSGIWFNCVVRGDVEWVKIGEHTNIQDGTVIHVTRGGHPTRIGSGITVGHSCILHACTLEDNSFIGMGALVMDDAVVESGAMLAAGAQLTPGKRVPKGQLWAGRPAKYFRDLTQAEIDFIPKSAENYYKHVNEYLSELA